MGGVLVFVAVLLAATSVLTSSPVVCARCHARQSRALSGTAHARIDCYGCHLEQGWWSLPGQKADEFFGMYPAHFAGRKPSGPVRQVAKGRCLSCHRSEQARLVRGERLQIKHSTCALDVSCDVCHAETGHPAAVRWKTGRTMESCTACHSREGVDTRCGTCHLRETDSAGDFRSPWRAPHREGWKRTHGMRDAESCRVCHEAGFCTKCHEIEVPHAADFGTKHGAVAAENPASCTTCHKEGWLCSGCHQIEMPHPPGFTMRHSAVAQGLVDPRCFRCHAEGDCNNCHDTHVHPDEGKGTALPANLTPDSFPPKGGSQ